MRPGAIMLILTALSPALAAAADSDAVFNRLDLSRPGLEKVRAAVEAGDMPAAAAELKSYFRARTEPVFITDRHSRPEKNPDYNTGGAEKVLRREFAFVGKPSTLTHDIDWNANPLNDVEWPIELNRHGIWSTLARAYWHTHDEKYAEDVAYQLADWLNDNPRPESPRGAKWTWRTLELGIRLGGSWPEVFFRLIDSEHFTPELVCGMLESIYQQADYLMQYHGGGNWLVCEKSGLVTTGIVFPEFKDAERWLSAAWGVLSAELEAQVYPDGAQIELTPHYHSATLSSFRRACDIADRNSVEPPPAYRDQMERMYEYLMYVVKPDGYIPMFNDSDHGNMRGWMSDGARRFDRQDMLFVATGGEQGEPPAGPSHAFPWAGQYVMRSGWTQDDIYLALDAGPFGLGHQHEDKLTIDVWGYGQEMILDPGRYTYQGGKWRGHFVSTASHNTILVGGQGQQRRRTPRSTWVTKEPLPNRWISNEHIDLAVGSYEDGYAGAGDLIHVRKVLFVKPKPPSQPGYFLVSDHLLPYGKTTREHEMTVQFQLARPGAQLDDRTLAVHSVGPDANVLVMPAATEGVKAELHEGEEDPPAGWIGWSLHQALKEPATLAKYLRSGVPPLRFDTLIFPYRGEAPPAIQVAQAALISRLGPPVEATELQIRGDGWMDAVCLAHAPGGTLLELGFGSTDHDVCVWRYTGGSQPSTSVLAGGTGLWPDVPRIEVPEVALDTPEVRFTTAAPAIFRLRYGVASGGGHLFETETPEPVAEASLSIQSPRYDLPYAYELQLKSDDRWRVVQRGTVLVPEPSAFDFEDGTLQGWEAPEASLVDGQGTSKGALRVEAAEATQATYISARRPQRFTTAEDLSIALHFRAPVSDGGDWFYAKVTLRDEEGLDWSAYFAREPSETWQEVNLSFGDFRGDTQEHPLQGKPMPAGRQISGVSVTLRKGETAEPVAPEMELDNIRIDD